ncbi:hypothetical protein LCGC14_2577510 [marine sediment metagenome]|uniref:Uncharacterized protein n=1 Tax=marine sediment metagenome TaxID=412755 RepID=A0A0F9AFH5_9ZZZZ
MLLGTFVYFWISWHIALFVRVSQVAVDTCQEWWKVSQQRAERREEESE